MNHDDPQFDRWVVTREKFGDLGGMIILELVHGTDAERDAATKILEGLRPVSSTQRECRTCGYAPCMCDQQ